MITITGAAGGIGSVLADELLALGHELCLIDDLSGGDRSNFTAEANRNALHVLDIMKDDLPSAVMDSKVIFHLAAISSLAECQKDPARAIQVNVAATARMAEIARQSGAHLVFASTSAVYENNSEYPLTENQTVKPNLTYSLSKHMAEMFLSSQHAISSSPVTILRFFNVFGPRQNLSRLNPPLVNYLVRELTLGRTPKIYAEDSQARDYVHVDDVVSLIVSLLSRPPAGFELFNVCSGREITIAEILKAVERGLGVTYEPVRGRSNELWDMHEVLFEGAFPLKKEVVEAETRKRSLGSPTHATNALGWSANVDVLKAIEEEATSIADKARRL